MASKLEDVIQYILFRYPVKDDLSKARLTKLVYLVDWKYTINFGHQLTSVKWYFDNYGPFVWDIIDTVNENPDQFEVIETVNSYGSEKSLIRLKTQATTFTLSDEEKKIIDFVIDSTKNLTWNQFIRLVYNTYPVKTTEKYNCIDMMKALSDYSEKKKIPSTRQ